MGVVLGRLELVFVVGGGGVGGEGHGAGGEHAAHLAKSGVEELHALVQIDRAIVVLVVHQELDDCAGTQSTASVPPARECSARPAQTPSPTRTTAGRITAGGAPLNSLRGSQPVVSSRIR